MRRVACVLASAVLLIGSFAALAVNAQEGQPLLLPAGCVLPFDELLAVHEIDQECAGVGKTTSLSSQVQNRAKNDFCSTGTPTRVTVSQLSALHVKVQQAGIPYSGSSVNSGFPPTDRSALEAGFDIGGVTLGEGSLVTFIGFVDDAHHSNVGRGETVNCKRTGSENNDIHIEMSEVPGAPSSQRVTAEVSPHFRPLAWTPTAIEETAEFNRPVRFTGHLFFDGAHNAAPDGNSWRASGWEIHPVYDIEVCRLFTISDCEQAGPLAWTPLHLWDPENEEPLPAPGGGTEPATESAGAVTLVVDLRAETATITNGTSSPIDLEGWELVSVRGNQRFTFPAIPLGAGESVVVASGPAASDEHLDALVWTSQNVWNNSGDPGQLLDGDGNLVADAGS